MANIFIEKPPQSNDEFDYLTTEFGAYFGQLIHSSLMKLRNQRLSSNQAQMVAASIQSSRTIVSNQVTFIFNNQGSYETKNFFWGYYIFNIHSLSYIYIKR